MGAIQNDAIASSVSVMMGAAGLLRILKIYLRLDVGLDVEAEK